MLLQGREDVVWQRGSFLSPEREAGCTGGGGRPATRAPSWAGNGEQSLHPTVTPIRVTACPRPPPLPTARKACLKTIPSSLMLKPLVWLESSVFHRYVHVWGRPCWVGGGQVWGHLLFTPKDRFSTGDKFGIRQCRNSPAENEQQPPGTVGRAAPPQPPGRTPAAPPSEGG